MRIAGLQSIPQLIVSQQTAAELLDEAMATISAVIKAQENVSKPTESATASVNTSELKVPIRSSSGMTKDIKVIRPVELTTKKYLETEAEVETYLSTLRKELMAVVSAGQRARIQ